MKKLFLFAAAAAMFAACSETEVLDQNANQQAIENQGGVKFDVYAQRGITRGGGQTGDLNNANIGPNGFGVFAYYTAGEQYSTSATPNFMYNQQVTAATSEANPASYGTIWKYEPVKYWPNEYGDAAISDEIDYVTFFAYAPWTKIEPTTGEVDVTGINGEAKKDSAQNYNIISVNKNTATGDPIVKYVVDTNPATSVDLLWGIAAENAVENYTPIDGKEGSKMKNAGVVVNPGLPFIDLVKPNDPAKDKLVFNLKHALAKVRITIDYIADQKTPKEGTYPTGTAINDKYEDDAAPDPVTDIINADETRIWVRQFSIEGWTNKGALNLNNTEPGLPLWKDFDGVKELVFSKMIYQDGLKDGAEGQGKIDKGESLKGLNPCLLEDATVNAAETTGDNTGKIVKFSRTNPGVGAMTVAEGKLDIKKAVELKDNAATVQATASGANLNAKGAVGTTLLFGGDPKENNGYFYVIPRNNGEDVNVTIAYDVETIDPALANIFSDNLTKGSSIENIITKEAIFGKGIDFEPGYQYDIHLHLGMTSVKVEATVTPWIDNGETIVNLPNNQDPNQATAEVALPDIEDTFYYISYFDKDDDVPVEAGSVEVVAVNNGTPATQFMGDYVQVEVKGTSAYAGNKFFVPVTAKTDGTTKTQLLTYDETDKVFKTTGIWVVISTSALTATDPVYAFTGVTYSASGTVTISAQGIDAYKITVKTNSDPNVAEGAVFYVKRPAKVGDIVELYTDAACETKANIRVKIGEKQ